MWRILRFTFLAGLALFSVGCADDSASHANGDPDGDPPNGDLGPPVPSAFITSVASGPWSSAETWSADRVPTDGDWVEIGHTVSIEPHAQVVVGHSPQAGDSIAAVQLLPSGTLTLGTGSTLVCRGDLKASGTITMEAGSVLEMDSSEAKAPLSSVYVIEITPGDTAAHLRINGAVDDRCELRSNSLGAHARITDGDTLGGGRVVADYADFTGLGGAPDYRAWTYRPAGDGKPYRLTDCTFDRSSQVKATELIPPGGHVEFERVIWTNSVIKPSSEWGPDEWWYIHETGAHPGATAKLLHCDFDETIALFYTDDYEIEDCVLRRGARGYSHWGGPWKSFNNNFVRWDSDESTGFGLPGGVTLEDNLFVVDPEGCTETNPPSVCWNPHFMELRADGGSSIIGNVWWWTGNDPNGEADGVILAGASDGSREENFYLFERNIYLPNGNGPDGAHNFSSTPFTILSSSNNTRTIFKRNTVYAGNWLGGCNIGESGVTSAHDIGYFKSNLFIGSSTHQGYKIHNLGNAEADAVVSTNADYNAGYRLADGSNFGNGSGKGYHDLYFTGGEVIGANDLDDVSPEFVDPTRTPATWDAALGGAGTVSGAMDRLSPEGDSTVEELLEYIRQGFRPQNPILQGAGDPDDSPLPSPDIGAVDLAP